VPLIIWSRASARAERALDRIGRHVLHGLSGIEQLFAGLRGNCFNAGSALPAGMSNDFFASAAKVALARSRLRMPVSAVRAARRDWRVRLS